MRRRPRPPNPVNGSGGLHTENETRILERLDRLVDCMDKIAASVDKMAAGMEKLDKVADGVDKMVEAIPKPASIFTRLLETAGAIVTVLSAIGIIEIIRIWIKGG